MTYKIIKTTDGKNRGTIFEIKSLTIHEIKNKIELIFDMPIDSIFIQGVYIQMNNSNYTIIIKEVSLNG
jgi:hypothetical protein